MFKFIIIIVLIATYIYFNLGNYLDVTKTPKQSDLLVCLGGGKVKDRINKTIELYQNSFLKQNNVIFTGIKKIDENMYQNIEKNKIIINNNVKNTMEEVIYIKKFIKENNLSSVTFITEAPHSRRIQFFWNHFGEKLENVEFSIVASELESWNSNNYYKNNINRKYAFNEIIKLIYNVFVYIILENIGLKEKFESTYKKELIEIKKYLSIKFN